MPKHSYLYKAVNRALGQALHRYNMIAHGDRILVGLSGGKDSLSLMWFLNERKQRILIDYELVAVYIDLGFDNGFSQRLESYAGTNGYDIRIEYTDYGRLAHSAQNRENPCFLCARLRRQRLFELAEALKCNKIALGHNKDDFIETLFMNMCYAGEISTMLPSQSFFNGKFDLIRPLAFVDEDTLKRFARQKGFPEFINPCPSARVSKRQEIKKLLQQLYAANKKTKGNIFRSMSHIKPEYMLKPKRNLSVSNFKKE
jgi:tRNA 2-thiocytidine biosynthesis protein TtcA